MPIKGGIERKTASEAAERCSLFAGQCTCLQDVLKNLGFECIDKPPYSSDLASSDYFPFPNLKKTLKGRKFSNDSKVIAAEQFFSDQTSEFFLEGLKKLEKGVRSVLNFRVNMWNSM